MLVTQSLFSNFLSASKIKKDEIFGVPNKTITEKVKLIIKVIIETKILGLTFHLKVNMTLQIMLIFYLE